MKSIWRQNKKIGSDSIVIAIVVTASGQLPKLRTNIMSSFYVFFGEFHLEHVLIIYYNIISQTQAQAACSGHFAPYLPAVGSSCSCDILIMAYWHMYVE